MSSRRNLPRVAFASLVERGLLSPGQLLYFKQNRSQSAQIRVDGKLNMQDKSGTIHTLARALCGGRPCNGWDHWYFENSQGKLESINSLRQQVRDSHK